SIERFAGSSEAEARAFVFRIARRRIADFFRAGRFQLEPLAVDRGSGEEPHPGLAARGEDGMADAVEAELLVSDCLAKLRPDHREIVELCVFEGFSAREAVARLDGRDS